MKAAFVARKSEPSFLAKMETFYIKIAYKLLRAVELTIFDIENSHILSKTSPVTQSLSNTTLLDDGTRVLASDTSGAISMWDKRVRRLSQRLLTTKKSIRLTQNLEPMVKEIKPLKEKVDIQPKELLTTNTNSGVLDMHNNRVSHIHCPRLSLWLDRYGVGCSISTPQITSWLREHSIYAVASNSSNGLHLLDFHPRRSSSCHVDHQESNSLERLLSISKAYLYRFLNMLLLVPFIHLMTHHGCIFTNDFSKVKSTFARNETVMT